MPHRIPAPLMASSGAISRTFTSDTYIGNLWTYLGSPSVATDVELIVDGADIGDVQITLDWPAGSTFTITCINDGRILGLGGDGGDGGADLGSGGSAGSRGTDGGSALSSEGFTVNLDVDDGYLLGGGGGGGGGSAHNSGSDWLPGGGGGGGQGFSATSGGAAGSGSPSAAPGSDGDQAAPGTGGGGGGTGSMSGGFGGTWGNSGNPGLSSDILGTNGLLNLYGGPGGTAGPAFDPISGGTLSLSGSKSEATLRSEGRIRGETAAVSFRSFGLSRQAFTATGAAPASAIITFATDGDFTITGIPAADDSEEWLTGSDVGIGSDYDLRIYAPAAVEQSDGSWDSEPAVTPGTWMSLGSARTFSMSIPSGTGIDFAASMMEIRRADDINGKALASFIIRCKVEVS